MSVIPFPACEQRDERLLGVEKCLDFLCDEVDGMGLELLAHLIAVARDATRDIREEAVRTRMC